MTHERDLERLLDSWLTDGPLVVADRVIDGVEARIVRQPQRPAWRLRPWRFPTMSTPIRVVVLVGALLAALAAGAILSGGAKAPPSPSPTLAPTAAPSANALLSMNGLPAGRYANDFVAGRLTFTLPAGWSSSDVSQLDFGLHFDAGAKDDTVKVFTDMRRASKASACPEAPEPTAGETAASIAQDLAADPRILVTRAGSLDLGSGVSGEIIDVLLPPSTTATCPFSNGQPTVALVVDRLPGEGAYWGIARNERIRLVLLDAPRGHNLVVAIDAADASTFQALVDATMPVVRSFSFEAGAQLAALPRCEDDLFGCAGPLAAGPHQSVAFQPGLSFTTPAGWDNVIDTPTIFKLDPGSSADPYLILWSNVAIPDGCGPAIKPKSGTKVNDFVTFLEGHPGVEILSNRPAMVGRWTGRALDLRVKDGYADSCGGPGNAVQFIVDTDPLAGTPVYGVGSGGRMHVVFVDVNGQTVIIQAYGPDSDAGLATAIASVQPLIDSFQFAPAT